MDQNPETVPFLSEAPPHASACVFVQKDKDGYEVFFEQAAWDRLLNNPFYPSRIMQDKISDIQRTIAEHDKVHEVLDPTPDGKGAIKHRMYYRRLESATNVGHNLIKVVVKIIDTQKNLGKITNATPING